MIVFSLFGARDCLSWGNCNELSARVLYNVPPRRGFTMFFRACGPRVSNKLVWSSWPSSRYESMVLAMGCVIL